LVPKTEPKDIEKWKGHTLDLIAVRQQVALLSVTADDGTRIVIDAKRVFTAPLQEPIAVEPGQHRVEAFKDGLSIEREEPVEAGKEYPLPLDVKPPPARTLAVARAPDPLRDGFLGTAYGVLQIRGMPPALLVRVLGYPEIYNGLQLARPGDPLAEPLIPFRLAPIIVGGSLTLSAGIAAGVLATKATSETDERTKITYQTAAIWTGVGSLACLVATAGFAFYENRRTSITYAGNVVSVRRSW
jgi:hypothetical protein